MLRSGRFASKLGAPEALVKALALLRHGHGQQTNHFAQAFDTGAIVSERHLLLSYENARLAFAEKRNFSSTMELEVLGRAAGTRRINEAIAHAGVKRADDFILLFEGEVKAVEKALNARELKPTFRPDAAEIARKFGIAKESVASEGLEKCVLEAVAMADVE
jgi:tRNA threonylcarbamoyladenosine modification (KEOPS) complex Cgi121 subunit